MAKSRSKWLKAGICGFAALPMAVYLGFTLQSEGKVEIARPAADTPVENKPHHPTHINRPDGPPTILTGALSPDGTPAAANCTTCHATREPNALTLEASQLKDFHTGLTFEHGESSCLTCHNPRDYNTLRLADDRTVAYTDVMQLCAQCHGPQYRDYTHGSHGGMTGYWDTTRGERHRNNCIDCHDPHAPKYPVVQPVFPPRDRAIQQSKSTHEADHE